MRRRTLLRGAVASLPFGTLVGCLGADPDSDDHSKPGDDTKPDDDTEPDDDTDSTGDDGNSDGTDSDVDANNRSDPSTFEECGRLIIDYSEFPPTAQAEIDAALGDGYETGDEAYLPNMMRDQAYVRVDGTTYIIDVTTTGETTRLVAEEAIPSRGRSSFRVVNRTDGSVSVSVAVVRDRTDETVLDAETSLEPDESASLGAFERTFGTYTATMTLSDQAETITWREEEMSMSFEGVEIRPDEMVAKPRAVLEPVDCQGVWGLDG